MCFKEKGKERQWHESTGAPGSPSRTGSEVGPFPLTLHRKPRRWRHQEQVTMWKQDSIS